MNGKTIVIYTSKYGSAEKYAKWIAEALACPVKGLKDIHDRQFLETFGSDVIFTSREQVEPLVNFILDGEKGIHTAADTLF